MTAVLGMEGQCLRHAHDVWSCFSTEHTTNVFFSLNGLVTALCHDGFVLKDETGRIRILDRAGHPFRKGDIVNAFGYVEVSEYGDIFPILTNVESVAYGTPEGIVSVPLGDLADEDLRFREIRVQGTVIDSFKDELGDRWNWFRISDNRNELMAVLCDNAFPAGRLDELLGSEIEATGVLLPRHNGTRTFKKPHLELMSSANLKVVKKAPSDPFDTVEECRFLLQNPVDGDFDFCRQYRVSGTVAATWKNSCVCLRIGRNKIVRVHLRHGSALPVCGSRVTIVGFVRRRLFFSTIVNAYCRVDGMDVGQECPVEVSVATIFKTVSRNWSANAFYDGQLVKTSGIVRNVSNSGSADGRLLVSADGHDFNVQIGCMPPPPIGSSIAVTGVCLMTAEQDPDGKDFEHMNGIMIIPRSPADMKIVSMPPWLTPSRLLMVVAVLAIVLGIVIAVGLHLRRVVARQARELAGEQIRSAEAAFKIEERTRLAVEIHDALSQTLSAVSMQLGAIRRFADSDREKMLNRIALAAKSLRVCRDEVRNCLWDLRSGAIEDSSLDTAIRRTLSPHIADAMELHLRFNVPRGKLTDNTTHTLLSIIRELVVNAIRHGKAKTIRIAGALEAGFLRFSVSDNGGGFDTANVPGIAEGHFGLQGIRERLEKLGGTLELASGQGRGTRATVLVKLPHQRIEDE